MTGRENRYLSWVVMRYVVGEFRIMASIWRHLIITAVKGSELSAVFAICLKKDATMSRTLFIISYSYIISQEVLLTDILSPMWTIFSKYVVASRKWVDVVGSLTMVEYTRHRRLFFQLRNNLETTFLCNSITSVIRGIILKKYVDARKT